MSIYTIQELRATAPENLRNLSDAELINEYAKQTDLDPVEVARFLGYNNSGGKWGNRFAAGIDNYQANLYGLGAAVSRVVGADGVASALDRRREANELDAATATLRARDLGAVDDWREVNGVGDFFDYVGGLGAQSLPYLAEAAVGGLAARRLMTGARAALNTAKTVEAVNKARRALNLGSAAGAVAASYPSAVADVLAAQRDAGAAPGEEKLGSALAGGVPYTLANAIGVSGLFARGLRPLAAESGNLLSRAAKTGLKTGVEEGVSELSQEGVNQYFGRMAVDPNETFFNEDANRRYTDAFVGGALLGKTVGTLGGIRKPIGDTEARDLLTGKSVGRPTAAKDTPILDEGPVTGESPSLDQSPLRQVAASDVPASPQRSYELIARPEYGLAPEGPIDAQPVAQDSRGRFDPLYSELPAPPSRNPNALIATEDGIVGPERVFTGQQYSLFGGPTTFGEAVASQENQTPTPPAAPDTQTRDMFVETPTAMVPTMFNPLEPSNTTGTIGAVAGNIRSQIMQQLDGGGDATLATQLSIDISKRLGDVQGMLDVIDQRGQQIAKNLERLDKRVTGDTNTMTPEEYEAKRNALEAKLLTVKAAKALVDRYRQALVNAYAQEGAAKAKEGVVVGQAPVSYDTETLMRAQNAARAAQQAAPQQAAPQQAAPRQAAPQQAAPQQAAPQQAAPQQAAPDFSKAPLREVIDALDTGGDAEYEAALRELARRTKDPEASYKDKAAVKNYIAAEVRKPGGAAFSKDWAAALDGRVLPSMTAKLSRRRASGRLSVEEVKSIADAIASKWSNAPEVVVVDSLKDEKVPRAVREYDEQQRSKGADGDVEGFFYKGKVYISADAVGSASDVLRVLFHEALGHYGLRGVFGGDLKKILQRVVDTRREDVAAKAKAYGLDPNSEADMLTAAEEVLAELAQTKPNLSLVQRAIAAIRSWLRNNVPGFGKLKLTNADIINDFILPARKFVEGKAKLSVGGAPDTPLFSRADTAPPTRASIEKHLAKLPENVRAPVRRTVLAVPDIVSRVLDRSVFLHTLIDRAVKNGIKSAREYAALHAKMDASARKMEREVEKVADLYAYVEEEHRGDGPKSVNRFIFESTRKRKWGYGPNADPEMKEWFDSFGPNAQAFIKAVFEHGDKVLLAKKDAVLKWAASEYDPIIADVEKRLAEAQTLEEKNTLTKELEELKAEKSSAVNGFKELFKIREGLPYAPIKRVGAWAVVWKSDEYRDAEEREDRAELRKLEQDENHYYVTFVDTKADARRLADRLAADGFYGAEFFEREKNDSELFRNSNMLGALTKLRARLGEGGNNPVREQMRKIVSDLWLAELAESSARKSEIRRRGIYGDVDMLQSFTLQGRADATFIAAVEFNPQIEEAVSRMRREVKFGGDRARKSEIFNEIMRRRAVAMDVKHNPAVDKLLRMSSAYFLATSPMYYMQNLMQPGMMSVPYMTMRHKYFAVNAALLKAYQDIAPVIKSGKVLETMFDYEQVPADVRDAIQELANRGRIDIGLETELGEFQIDGASKFGKTWNKIDKSLRLLVQKGEAINRLSTAIAAYRLELERTGSKEAAIDYADTVLRDTHGDYSRFNAPTFFNNDLGKIALQFRKFQLIQLTYYATLFKQAFTDPVERAAAIRALSFSIGHLVALGGLLGIPGYSALALVAGALFGDDDEPYDLTQEIRKIIGDRQLADVILRGAPAIAGIDLSGKVGAGQMLSILPFSDADLSTSRGRAEYLGTLVGGASFGLVNRLADGVGLMLDGDWVRGSERLLPKGLGDAIKAYREATQGITKRSGEVMISGEEIDTVETVLKALGVPQVRNNELYDRLNNLRRLEDTLSRRSTEIKRAYIKARQDGDSRKVREVIDEWRQLQEARARQGYKRQPLSDLLKAEKDRQTKERNKIDGVGFTKANKQYVEQLMAQ